MRSIIWSAVLVYAAAQAAAWQFGEPPLDLADPGVRRREVQLDPEVG